MITPNSSFPVFIVDDLSAAQAFYTRHFGFNVAFENEWYLHLVTETGVQIGFMLPEQPTQPEIFHHAYPGKGVIFSIEVENADAAYIHAREHHLNVVLDLRAEDWGQKHFSVEDPNGLYIDVVETIDATAEYEAGYTQT